MIDAIVVPPIVHMVVGTLVLLTSLIATLVAGVAVWKKKPLTRANHIVFILFQLALMVQVLIGIKLLDQGLGQLQLYIHYLGGLAPMGFWLVYYWLPSGSETAHSRRAATVSLLSFVFVFMTFAIGSAYVPGA
jgi:uncharacterized protein with PQ loop repeat